MSTGSAGTTFQDEATDTGSGGKNSMYEEDIRVPLWVRGPGVTAESTVGELLGNVDLAPTFCDIAGISPVGGEMDGRSFLPLLEGTSISWRTQYLISRGQAKSYAGIRSADEWVFAELDAPQFNEIRGEYYVDLDDPVSATRSSSTIFASACPRAGWPSCATWSATTVTARVTVAGSMTAKASDLSAGLIGTGTARAGSGSDSITQGTTEAEE